MAMVHLTIDGVPVSVEEGTTVLKAAHAAGIKIPTLCWLKDINEIGACRMCVVDVGARSLAAACVMPVSEGMVVKTNTPQVRQARRAVLELILSNHERKCLSCVRSQNCELQDLAKELGVDENRFEGENIHYPLDNFSPSIVRDPNKCILCRRCVAVCRNVQKIGAIGAVNRGFKTVIAPAFGKTMLETDCVFCGQCINACPVGALRERDDTDKVWDALSDPEKFVVVQPAPAVRVALGEEFGLPIGTRVTGKMTQALRRLGFDKVFDTDFGADLTIMEEATELLDRMQNGGVLPMITSCSPGWVNYAEYNFPDQLDHLSSCKSPHEMMGAIIKSYFAEKNGLDPKNIFVVSIMPCTAKKFEKERPQLAVNGLPDVDCVLTTRELGDLIKRSGINFNALPDEEFDSDLLGDYSGAGVIFGVTGGVMEAALRTAYYVLTGKEHELIKFEQVRGFDGIKEATIDIEGKQISVAVASGMKNAKVLMDEIRAGTSKYSFIEIMGCPGGCVAGGGQPYIKPCFLPNEDIDILDTFKEKRAAALYSEDERQTVRQSHNNAQIQQLYTDYLEKPNSHKAHELLHTTYEGRRRFS